MSLLDDLAARLLDLPPEKRKEIAQTARAATADFPHWVMNPGPQTEAFYNQADELFYGGEAGGGKTDLLLGTAMNGHRKSLLLRRLNGEVSGLMERMEAILGHRRGLRQQPPAHWKLPGRLVKFSGCQHADDWTKHQGNPHDFYGFDEITNFLESQYRALIAWNRSVTAGQRSRVIATGNPPTTPEGMWVIKYWAPWLDPNYPNPAVDGELRWFTTIGDLDVEVDGPGQVIVDGRPLTDSKGNPIFPKSRTFIRAELSDNPDLEETGYRDRLMALPGPMRAAMGEGDFTASVKDDRWQVFPTAWVEAAMQRWDPTGKLGRKMEAVGVDIAQGGTANTVMAPRYGKNFFDRLHVYPGKETPDGPTVGGLVMMVRRDGAEIIIDMGGGYGGATMTHLDQNGIAATGFNGAHGGTGRDRSGMLKFANKRAQAHWALRDALDPEYGSNLMLPPDPELKADMASIRWKPGAAGVTILSKEEIMKLIGRSPDRSDAVVIAHFADGKTADTKWDRQAMPATANLSSRRPPRRGR